MKRRRNHNNCTLTYIDKRPCFHERRSFRFVADEKSGGRELVLGNRTAVARAAKVSDVPHLPNLIADLIYRLRLPTLNPASASFSIAAREHGELRRRQGYTPAMVVEESRILQVSIFNTLQKNLAKVDFSKVLLDVITIADEVDSQLKQAMLSYVAPIPNSAWSAA